MLEILVGNNWSRIVGDVPGSVRYFLDQELSYTPAGAYYMLKAANKGKEEKDEESGVKKWDGKIKLYFPNKGHTFYTGLLSPVGDILKNSHVPFKLIDQRIRPPQNLPNLQFVGKKENRPYQTHVIDKAFKATRGIIQVATGGGKTVINARLIAEIKSAPFLYMVLSGDLLEQAYEELSSMLNVPIGRVGFGYFDIQGITVITVQSAIYAINFQNPKFKPESFDEDEEYKEPSIESKEKADAITGLVRDCVGFCFDEVQHAASRTAKEVILAAPNAFWRYGCSATPTREDGAEIFIQALLGRIIAEVPISWLIQHKYLVPCYILNVVFDQHLGDPRHYPNAYTKHIVENDLLHSLTCQLISVFEENKVSSITLVQQYLHGDTLAELKKIPFIKGCHTRKQRKDAINKMRTGEQASSVATTLADEGLDIPRLGGVVISGGGNSVTRIFQRIGRTLRVFPGKSFAVAVIFHHSGSRHLDKHGKRVLNILKKEKEFTIINSTPETAVNDLKTLLNKNKVSLENMG